jgi:hypothetical protein
MAEIKSESVADFIPESPADFARNTHFWTAKRTLAGIEAMAMLAKGQVRAVPRGDMLAQRAFVQQIFGLAA